ncbi:Kinesin heavy chain, putative isoform 3 [Theobroma cacao]|uniref:Kinesin heavy chain, putative isoform 3 n=1 Tax=Theobroma cacao TaxID=3641 RepID=A0A061EVV7_THECC|nr:Kinesin heavy chain, putative isoform 3 [Theobroma cacao]
MEYVTRTGFHDLNLASRKAEEAALRRYVAVAWLETLVGPLGISSQPSEKEFISCLRNGLILCNVINKIQPGAVPKVVESNSHAQSLTREFQPPPAYQYFENVRNFLVAIEELKLPAFEACDLERDNLEAGSAAKVVDCILALKSYHEYKQINCGNGNGYYKLTRSPMVMHSATKIHSRSSSESCRRLEMSAICDKQPTSNGEIQKLEGTIVKVLADYMADTKENVDDNLLGSFHERNPDSVKLLKKMILSCLDEQLQDKFPELKSVFKGILKESNGSTLHSTPMALEDVSSFGHFQGSRAGTKKANRNHRHLLKMQEKELLDLKALLSTTKREFEHLQLQLQVDLKDLGSQVEEMSTAALQYYKVVEENRKLYNMVQDLKGNIRVFCRIRPAFCAGTRNAIDFIGEDGSLVILDPLKPQKDGRKVFQFNRVFGPSATQDDVFKDTQPLIRSVMDGYNVCIFAYGQTGSGKTYTMSGPSGGSTEDLGINYLALNDLFEISNQRKDIISYEIQVQMVEIYNEQIRDLLSENSSSTKLEIHSCPRDNGLSLPDATMHTVKSASDVLNLMKFGEVNRVVCSTALNNRSSRSHSILTVHVHGKDASGNMLRSCLHLVDLAGSERVDKSEVTGDRLKEAQYINKSLSCLGDVITALAQKNTHTPYRNSKLTLLLQDSLGGHAKTLMFAHVSPEGDSFGETISTLKFAQRVSTVELGAARLNKESSEVMQLKEQIENLKKALANKEAQSTLSYKIKEPKSPFEKQKATIEKTPPRTRRLGIENGSTKKSEKAMNCEDRKGPKTPSVPTRARRLSLEGPRYVKKDNSQINVSEDVSKSLHASTVSVQKYSEFQEAEAVTKQFGDLSSGSSIMDVYFSKAPRSPASSSFQKQAQKVDCRTQIPRLQLPKTPEPQVLARNDIQAVMQSEHSESRMTIGKGSQIRKSLRSTIGKLISGSEKRNLQNSVELKSPIMEESTISDVKLPLTANARAMRRQSLTGIQTSGSDRSRRSSLGGKPTDSSTTPSSNRNAKTPPPVHPSTKTTKRWL